MADKRKTETPKRKPLLDPNGPRVNVTDTGGEYAGRRPESQQEGPGIVHPGAGGEAAGQTTHE